MSSTYALPVQLHHDYEQACNEGWRHRQSDPGLTDVADRLVAAKLATYDGKYFNLQRPEYGAVDFPTESLAILLSHYERWLHAVETSVGEQLLHGRSGFWQHWWNMLHERSDEPLSMDLVAPDVPEIHQENWLGGIQEGLLAEVIKQNALKLRLLIPPSDAASPLAAVADLMTREGFEVRVRSSQFLFAVYGRTSAVLSAQETSSDEEGYFLTRRLAIVTPLQRVFDEHWASAIPWNSYTLGTADVLELMSLGWTDTRIAEALGLSMRTLSRRVADAMSAAGVASRFELGMKYGQSRL